MKLNKSNNETKFRTEVPVAKIDLVLQKKLHSAEGTTEQERKKLLGKDS